MEIVIIISLVIIIALLLVDKSKITKQKNQSKTEELSFKQDLPISIMGESKPVILKQSLVLTNQEEYIDLEEEEIELRSNSESLNNEFTQSINMDEIYGFVNSIEQELINEDAIKTAQKIEGSELLELLQQAMPTSAKTIAKLLDQSLSIKSPKKEEVIESQDFNINDFV